MSWDRFVMCFSAPASFTTAAILIPVGIYSLYKTYKMAQTYWLFSLYPLVFGIQQGIEGWLWLILDTSDNTSVRIPALGFTFFSHFFWLFWLPFSCAMLENNGKKQLFLILALIGGLYGLSLYIPALMFIDWLQISLIQQSISYQLRLIYDDLIPRSLVRWIYVLIVLAPLLLSSQRYIRYFGIMIAISVVVATILFAETFISVWCFFAAALSIYILYMTICLEKQWTMEH